MIDEKASVEKLIHKLNSYPKEDPKFRREAYRVLFNLGHIKVDSDLEDRMGEAFQVAWSCPTQFTFLDLARALAQKAPKLAQWQKVLLQHVRRDLKSSSTIQHLIAADILKELVEHDSIRIQPEQKWAFRSIHADLFIIRSLVQERSRHPQEGSTFFDDWRREITLLRKVGANFDFLLGELITQN